MDQERLWVERTLRGDQSAFAHLVDLYKSPIYNLCYRMLGNPAEAEDAAQETFVRVYTHLKAYDPQQKLSSWVLAVASHYCVDRLRRRRWTWLSLDDEHEVDPPASEVVHPEDVVMQNESSAEIQRWLQALPAEYRLVIALRYWQDLSYAEIAQATGSSESAVKSRLHRARCMLAQQAAARARPEVQSNYGVMAERTVLDHAAL